MKAIRKIKSSSSASSPSLIKRKQEEIHGEEEEIHFNKFTPLSFPEKAANTIKPSISSNYIERQEDRELQQEKDDERKKKKKKKIESDEKKSEIDSPSSSPPTSSSTSFYYIPEKLPTETKEEELILNNKRYALLFSYGLWGPASSSSSTKVDFSSSVYSSTSSLYSTSLFSTSSTTTCPSYFLPESTHTSSSSSMHYNPNPYINFDYSLVIDLLDREFLKVLSRQLVHHGKHINFVVKSNKKEIMNSKNMILLNNTISFAISKLTLINTSILNYHDDIKELLKNNTIISEIELNDLSWLTDKFFIFLITNHFLLKTSKFDGKFAVDSNGLNSSNPHLKLNSPTKNINSNNFNASFSVPSNYLKKLNLNSLNITHYSFFSLLKYLIYLNEIIFINCQHINDMCILEMSKEIKNLKKLVIKHNSYITNNSMMKMIENNSSELIELIIHNCTHITDELFSSFTLLQAEEFFIKKEDEKIDFEKIRMKNKDKYENLNALNKKKNSFKIIKKVELYNNNNLINMNSILFIATSCIYLKELNLIDCNNLNINNVLKELLNLNFLEILKLSLPTNTSSSTMDGPSSTLLNSIKFSIEKNPLNNLSKLDKLKHKKKLKESFKKNKDEDGEIFNIGNSKININEINYTTSLDNEVDYNVFTYYMSLIMKQNKNLIELNLINFYSIPDKCLGFIFDNICNENFHTLKVKNSLNFSLNSIEGLVNNNKKSIKVLKINHSLKFYGSLLNFFLKNNKNLLSLSLNYCSLLTNYDFNSLFYLVSLKKLNLNYCSPLINEDIFKNFKDLISLEELYLENLTFSNDYYNNLSTDYLFSPFPSFFLYYNKNIFYNLKILNLSNIKNFNYYFLLNIFDMFPNLNCINLTLNYTKNFKEDVNDSKKMNKLSIVDGSKDLKNNNDDFLSKPRSSINYEDLLQFQVNTPFLNLIISSEFTGFILFHPNSNASISPGVHYSDYNIFAEKIFEISFPQFYEDMLIDENKDNRLKKFDIFQSEDKSIFVEFPLEIHKNFFSYNDFNEVDALYDSSLYYYYSNNIKFNINNLRNNELKERRKLDKRKEIENSLFYKKPDYGKEKYLNGNKKDFKIITLSSYNFKNNYNLNKNFFLFNSKLNILKRRIKLYLQILKHNRDLMKNNKNKEEKWKILKSHSCVILQSFFRMSIQRKKFLFIKSKILIIQKLIKKFMNYKDESKFKFYLSYYHNNLLKKVFFHIRNITIDSHTNFATNFSVINKKRNFFSLLYFFKLWIEKQDELKESYFNQISASYFKYNILNKVINSWKLIIKNKDLFNYNELKLFNIKKFFIINDFSYYNSSRQIDLINSAKYYYLNSLVVKAFEVLSHKIKINREMTNRNNLIIKKHLAKVLNKKFLQNKKQLILNLKYLIELKKYNKILYKRLLAYKKLLILKKLKRFTKNRQSNRINFDKLDFYYFLKMSELFINVLNENKHYNNKFTNKFNFVINKLTNYRLQKNFALLKSNIINRKNDKIFTVNVVNKYNKKIKYKYFYNIILYNKLNSATMARFTNEDGSSFEQIYYEKKLLKKFFNYLLNNKNIILKVKNDLIKIIKEKITKNYNEDLLINNKNLLKELLIKKINDIKNEKFSNDFLPFFYTKKKEKESIRKIKLKQQKEMEDFNLKLKEEQDRNSLNSSIDSILPLETKDDDSVRTIKSIRIEEEYVDSDDLTEEEIEVDEMIEEEISLSEYEREMKEQELIKIEQEEVEITDKEMTENIRTIKDQIEYNNKDLNISDIDITDDRVSNHENTFNKTLDLNAIIINEKEDYQEVKIENSSKEKSPRPMIFRKRNIKSRILRKRPRTNQEIESILREKFFKTYDKIHPLDKISNIFNSISLQRSRASSLKKSNSETIIGSELEKDEDSEENSSYYESIENQNNISNNEIHKLEENDEEKESNQEEEISLLGNEESDISNEINKKNNLSINVDLLTSDDKIPDSPIPIHYSSYFPKFPSPSSTPLVSTPTTPISISSISSSISKKTINNSLNLPSSFTFFEVKELIPDDLEKSVAKILGSIVKIQAIIRKILTKSKIHDVKINKIYYIMVIQKFARVVIAKKKRNKLLKLLKIEELLREENEIVLMNENDMEMREYSYLFNQIILIQKFFRGYKGRYRSRLIRSAKYLHKAKEEQRSIQHLKDHHQAYKRAQLAKELLKVRCIIQIQKIMRGKIARNLYAKLKLNKLISKHAVCVQRSYKRRMAVLQLQAMKRDVNNLNRFTEAKLKRGALFRFFQIKSRKVQQKILNGLNYFGLDPITFHYSLKEIIDETKEDYITFINTVKREYALLKKHRFNFFSINFNVDKRNELVNEGYKFKLQDTVRIIDQENKYYGLTGRIVRIDETILGKPLFEVLLDRYNIITTLRMSTDPLLIYMKNSSTLITKVNPSPEIIEHKNKFRIFPHTRKLYSKLNTKKKIFAAWTIQRAYRCYYSKKIAVRLRYEKWQENISRQWQLYYQLSEFNALNSHGYGITSLLKTHAKNYVHFDEISHPFYPSKLKQSIKKLNEQVEIKKEIYYRYKDRQTFLQKSLLMRNKNNFTLGTEKLTLLRKLSFFFQASLNLFLMKITTPSNPLAITTTSNIKDIRGSHGIKYLNQKGSVTGTDTYYFPNLKNSPHVRYFLTTLYQGEWSGVPFITSLKPHGEGLLMFLDAWGFVKEDKVLYLSIIKCNNLLTMDSNSSDPYCDIFCNNFNVQTSIKYKNLNPEFYESFEIDVTNPMASVNIVVKDYDILSNDDFIGQINLVLNNYSNDEEYSLKLNLLNEDLKYDYNRGNIEIRLKWSEKKNEDDDKKLMKELKSIIRIQSWYREIKSLRYKKILLANHKENLIMIKKAAVLITSVCRVRIAKKKFKFLLRTLKACIKIQKRMRIFIAKKIFKEKKKLKVLAIRIQRISRSYLAKLAVHKLREERDRNIFKAATIIQKYARKYLAYSNFKEILEEREEEFLKEVKANKKNGIVIKKKKVKVSEWIGSYGCDEEYGLRRNRRIIYRLFNKLIKLKYQPVVTKMGICYVLSHPPIKTEEELLLELQGSKIEYPFPREEYISLFLPTIDTKVSHRKDVIKAFENNYFFSITHMNTSINIKKSVFNVVIVVQNFFRQFLARKAKQKLIRINKAFSVFQLKFRQRYLKIYKASIVITNFVRLIRDFKYAKNLRKELDSVKILQNNWRIYLAKTELFNLRSVELISIFSYSPEPLSEINGPQNIFQHTSETFWVSKTIEHSSVKVEFSEQESIVEIWIMPCMSEASPLFFSLSYLKNKEDNRYENVIHKKELPLLKNNQWFKISLEHNITSKYFKVDFYDNYGDENFISLKQVRFIRSKEKSVEIIKQPNHFILNPGPMIGEEYSIVLKCEAIGWPLPSYQWYYGEIPIENATKNELKLNLLCESKGERTYRCARCKMIGSNVPNNAFHTECGNCNYLFTNRDIEYYDNLITQINKDEEELNNIRVNLISSKVQIENFNNNSKYRNLINDFEERIEDTNNKILTLFHKKFLLKRKMHVVNNYTNEGIYTCKVTNIRGKTMKLTKKSTSVVVVIEKPKPFWVEVVPFYQPRIQTIRKKWNFYSSIFGTFTKGRIDGLVLIKYTDGSIYEGPYISEDLIDNMGKTHKFSRLPDHYGIYKLPDGRIFEGENVDNHFDPFNLQEFYRLKINGEVYEGKFCDEQFHGIGLYKYLDGSIYEGQWHRGTRFGQGHFRSSDGWTYEGFFDKDRRHRKGVIDWPDNSTYMGNWYYGVIKGNGIFISTLRDIYRGEFLDGKFNGQGELVYSDGSVYMGSFKDGLRHGKGVFISKNGDEYYGHYSNDQKIGEHVVKIVIPIEESDQDNYEVRIGVYVDGNLTYWKSKFSNPIATKQFVSMFRQSRDMFDSVYSMILAKFLPNLPEGIDPNNQYVRSIIMKIRTEAGMLVGQQALLQAQNQCKKLLEPIENKRNIITNYKSTIESLSMKIYSLEKESTILLNKSSNLLLKYEKDSLKIEQYWLDEPKHVRYLFEEACKKLDEISIDEYFTFRNHRIVPLFVSKIFNAISYLLNIPIDWKQQQLLVSDSITNARSGDEEALRLNYNCKLAYLMKDYKVFNYVPLNLPDDFIEIISDVRFRMDSYYVSSLGPPGPILVNFIKTNYAYLRNANTIYLQLNAAEEKKLEGYRFKAQYNKKIDEIVEHQEKLDSIKEELKKNEIELNDLNHALLKAKDLLEFIEGRFNSGVMNVKRDYYKLLEEKLEKKRDFFNIEVCLQSIIDKVIDNHEKEQKVLKLQAFSMGKPYVEPKLIQYSIINWLEEEIDSQQDSILKSNRTLGYYHEKKPTDVTKSYTNQIISLIVDVIIRKLNDQYNEFASTLSWINLRGKKFNSRFLYIKAWQIWEKKATEIRDKDAINAWEQIFNNNQMLMATMAIESKVNHRMSSIARFQAKIWANTHKELIKEAEIQLSESFHAKYEGNLEKICEEAYNIEQNWLVDDVNPSLKSSCLCWINLHYHEMQEYRNLKASEKAEKFSSFYGDKAPVKAFQLLNGLLNFEEASSGASNSTNSNKGVVNTNSLNNWIEYASYWKEFNIKEYEAGGDVLLIENSKQFVDLYPLSSYYEAAKIVINKKLSELIPNELVKKDYLPSSNHLLLAYSYGIKNQGMMRKGKEMYHDESDKLMYRNWTELINLTNNFTKNSFYLSKQLKLQLNEFDIRNEGSQDGEIKDENNSEREEGITEDHDDLKEEEELGTDKNLSTNKTTLKILSNLKNYNKATLTNLINKTTDYRDGIIAQSKYSWLYGYISYKCDLLYQDLYDLSCNDPIHKQFHDVRPSKAEKFRINVEEEFLIKNKKLSSQYNDFMTRHTAFNNYLGWETTFEKDIEKIDYNYLNNQI